ncbi:YALI0F30745p [Yarrowia lipolytica CLIB122]|jgi:methylenetetrahydrofolate dehydrogenase (NADP+)/methenyltetrahydrofolate cyclohydrolase/formyltetrahydrofolate synthetase|uniref:C-1-tetrahydrofolate synthase, cytoplasmic n=3 Tax=Yarrowia lipolytica TaxID=4952 RepID=Q6BZU8_YARLI|nr:YALI0F30745p [Yarrowia lipolytica CLIB122]AOW07924.1 hypothetical protein YALI1_F38386g [Yarrowia lipolytica]KAJ8055042.1 formate--tetrahydrofolate ligase-domain-containing protein [Yarrowia lipolytica]CAG78877.1 YALI0F30745p [Yarrowia lipolytica CLIB122]VBB82238.1 C1 tetrahydrofolate synthase [Yarrowia lipolytica]|eukprot:XP_506064.1 YALI0F30745p [Yarrowia lipolytica CLIB122]
MCQNLIRWRLKYENILWSHLLANYTTSLVYHQLLMTMSRLVRRLPGRIPTFRVAHSLSLSALRHYATATNIDGKQMAKDIRLELHDEIKQIQAKKPHFQPKLIIIQVGERPDSSAYVRMKLKAAREAQIDCELRKFSEDMAEDHLLEELDILNDDPSVHGILVQLPLPKHINETRITDSVITAKDVDGFGPLNVGELSKRGGNPAFVPCTPKGVMEMLDRSGIELRGKNAVVIGRSDIVGTPVASLLKGADATVTVCHRYTENLPAIVKNADVVVAAIGAPNFVKGEWLKPGAVVVDVGINYVKDETKKSGQRLVGDVDFDSAKEVASFITPVPGGVGPMTVAMLVNNVVTAAKRQSLEQQKMQVKPLPLKLRTPVPSDDAISRAQIPKNVKTVAKEAGLTEHEFEPYGAYKGKVSLTTLDRLKDRKDGKYVLVAGITPTPLGEGKSTTTVGLVQAMCAHLGKLAFANVRQPSMGPTFGIKGGAAGGGYAQVIPMDEFNMHLTGDIHAISAATNLLAAAIDTRMFHESSQKDAALYKRLVPSVKGKRQFIPSQLQRLEKLGINKTNPNDLTDEEISKFVRLDIDPETITWKRVVDCNDRLLRGITVGEGPSEKGRTRETGFDISVASECMAILALSNSLADMRRRLGNMVVASSREGLPVTCDDIGAGGALTALMKDAIKPNLMQTLEGTPVFVHAGPFANISIGASSVLADKIALKLAGTKTKGDEPGYVVTEAGFDFTMGGERFFNIKCRDSGLVPDAVVIVATVRALKLHGGGPEVKPGAQLAPEYQNENVDLVTAGAKNLGKQIENARSFGVPVVVAINQFATDTPAEIEAIRTAALKAGAAEAIVSNHWEKGGEGAIDLAKGVVKVCSQTDNVEKNPNFKFLYDIDTSAEEKLNTIAKEMYGAKGIELSPLARKKIDTYTAQGFGNLPICIAKTQYSLSHDPALKGVPKDFVVPIRDVRASVGAGYLYALAADIMTIPGLPTRPGYMNVEVDSKGQIEGLF